MFENVQFFRICILRLQKVYYDQKKLLTKVKSKKPRKNAQKRKYSKFALTENGSSFKKNYLCFFSFTEQ
jgi:hypothetical protein